VNRDSGHGDGGCSHADASGSGKGAAGAVQSGDDLYDDAPLRGVAAVEFCCTGSCDSHGILECAGVERGNDRLRPAGGGTENIPPISCAMSVSHSQRGRQTASGSLCLFPQGCL
jgi:hypothetical protein